jgi:hypothetical protein
MSSIFVIAGVIAIVFCILKFIEMRFIEKETKPVKLLLKDTVIVYLCSVIGYYVLEQIGSLVKEGGGVVGEKNMAEVFTGEPEF